MTETLIRLATLSESGNGVRTTATCISVKRFDVTTERMRVQMTHLDESHRVRICGIQKYVLVLCDY